jgi:hypothetical protein
MMMMRGWKWEKGTRESKSKRFILLELVLPPQSKSWRPKGVTSAHHTQKQSINGIGSGG